MRKSPIRTTEKVNRFVADMTARFNAFVAFLILFVGLVVAVRVLVSVDEDWAALGALAIWTASTVVTIFACGALAVLLDIRSTMRMLVESIEEASKLSGQDSSSPKGKGVLGIG